VYRLPLLACLGALVVAAPLHAQGRLEPPYQDFRAAGQVNAWYQHFLHRNIDLGSVVWVNALQRGDQPAVVLATLLTSQEYAQNAGGNPKAYINYLFVDLTGAPPRPKQMEYWLKRSKTTPLRNITYELLLLYPQTWQVPGNSWYYHP
jgi:hypothetical protein